MRLFTKFIIVCNTLFIFGASSAWGFYTVQDTGDLLKAEQWQAAGSLQFVTSRDEGVNLLGRIDKGFNDESNFRFEAGFGTTDFTFGGYYKWVPFPDFENQPAIGFTFGAQYAHYDDNNDLALRVIPFVSKKFDTDLGELSPYAGLPLALQNYDDDTEVPIHLALGSRWSHPDFEHCDFNFELGFDLSEAFSYIVVGAVFPAFEWGNSGPVVSE